MILKVFTGKLKALTALSASTVSVASVSASATLSSDTRGSAVGVLNSAVDTVVSKASELTNTYIVNPAKNVGESYKSAFDKIKEGAAVDKIKPIGEGYKTFGTTTASLVQKYAMPPSEGGNDERIITRDNFETVNYYAFEYARVVKTVLETIGPLLNGTISTIAKDGSDLGNISVQKLIEIYKSDNTRDLMSSALSQLRTYQSKLKQANNDDLRDAIRILFSPSTENIANSLNQIKSNIDSLSNKNDSEFSDSRSLFKFILLGDKADETIKSSASTAKSTVNDQTIKTLLEGIEGINEEQLTQLSAALDAISGTQEPAAPPAS